MSLAVYLRLVLIDPGPTHSKGATNIFRTSMIRVVWDSNLKTFS